MTDAELVAKALLSLPKNNVHAGKMVGVSEGVVRSWRAGVVRDLRVATREKLEGYVREHPAPATGQAQENRSDDLSERLAAGESAAVIALLYEARAADARAQAMLVAEQAAKVRAEAMLSAEVATRERADAMRAEALGAYARAAATAPEGAVTAAEMLSSARAYERELARGTPPADEGAPLAATG